MIGRHPLAFLVGLAFVVAGCGQSGPNLGLVRGVVTLDGKPVANGSIHFTPVAGGRGSHARADVNGRYSLEFLPGRPGATVGTHRVSISTADEFGNSEIVPVRYNRETELEATVQFGTNAIDFKLKTS